MGKLTAVSVRSIKKIGMHGDGGGLYLKVQKSANPSQPTKSWIFRWAAGGAKTMGLGSLRDFSLAEARELANKAHKQFSLGLDPRAEREKERGAAKVAVGLTFAAAAKDYIKTHRAGWKNAKHAEQWENTLETYAFPKIGSMPCSAISTEHVVSVLSPIWKQKNETATRLRGRIEAVWDMAKAKGFCGGENPAVLKGNLAHFLPAISKRTRVKHHAAMPYSHVPSFVKAIASDPSVSAKALAMCILSATRTTETIEATWPEIDLEKRLWIIPKERMKKGREHRIPISDELAELIESLPKRDDSPYLFPSPTKRGKAMSNMAMLTYLKRRDGCEEFTVHGFRSSFRDWAGEKTTHKREVIEQALAHMLQDQAEAAYQRGDYLEKRKAVMGDWARYCFQ
jgi:integrase